jgi:predicted transcriptional regulator
MLPITAQRLGPLQIEILQLIWSHNGPLTVKQIHRTLRQCCAIACNSVR